MQKKKKRYVQCTEKELWLINVSKVVCEVLCWRFLDGQCSTVRKTRLVEVDSHQIETWIEKNQHYTRQEIASILKISKSIVVHENEKCVYFTEKTKQTFWTTPSFIWGTDARNIIFFTLLINIVQWNYIMCSHSSHFPHLQKSVEVIGSNNFWSAGTDLFLNITVIQNNCNDNYRLLKGMCQVPC